MLRAFNYCVIDEVDSVLIDEARTPLIISGPAEKSSERYMQAAQLADALERDFHYTVDEKQKSILITEEGYEAAEDVLQVAFPQADAQYPLLRALRMRACMLDPRVTYQGSQWAGQDLVADGATGEQEAGLNPDLTQELKPGRRAGGRPVRPTRAVGVLPHQCPQGEGAAGQGRQLHRARPRDHHCGRIHWPHHARPPLGRWTAPGALFPSMSSTHTAHALV